MTRYISVADTAKLVRKVLKEACPAIKFSVRSKSYSGGASMDICWTDGPTEADIKALVGRFEGSSFDGMEDLKSYHTSELNGEQVHFGADFIFTNREYTVAFLQRRAVGVAAEWGKDVPEVEAGSFGAHVKETHERIHGHYTLADLIWQKAQRTRGVLGS